MNMQPSSVTQPGFMFLLQGIGIVPLASPVFIVMRARHFLRSGIGDGRDRDDCGAHINDHQQHGKNLAKQAHRHPHVIRRPRIGFKPILGDEWSPPL